MASEAICGNTVQFLNYLDMKNVFLLATSAIVLAACGDDESSIDQTDMEMLDVVDFIVEDDTKSNNGFDIEMDSSELIELFDTVRIENNLYYVVQGDLLLSEDEANRYWRQINAHQMESLSEHKMVGERRNGMIIKAKNPENIKYAIIRDGFDSDKDYDSVVKHFKQATKDWARLCNVKFVYKSEKDRVLKYGDNPDDLDFIVQYEGYKPKAPIASAFFPYTPKENRKVYIFDRFLTTTASRAGIMRHEIGHILGFRHEHVRKGAPKNCPKKEEDMQYLISITDYDKVSVMHYPCGGAGSLKLIFSKFDTLGAQMYYPFKK